MPAAIGPEIIDRVREFWATQRDAPNSKRPKRSRRYLYFNVYVPKYGKEPSWGKFNEIISAAERKAPVEPFPAWEWKPWAIPEESAEDTAFLLRISVIKQAETGEPLYKHEARWGQRLRVALEDLHPFGQYRLVLHYSIREVTAYNLREECYTTDLDNLVAYKPWLPENQRAYHLAVLSGNAHYPNQDPFNTFFDPPPPEDVIEGLQDMVRRSGGIWWVQMFWTFRPWGTFVPDREQHPERARMLEELLQFWAGSRKTAESTEEEGVKDEREHS